MNRKNNEKNKLKRASVSCETPSICLIYVSAVPKGEEKARVENISEETKANIFLNLMSTVTHRSKMFNER